MEKAVCTSSVITLQDQKIKSSDYHFLCVGRLINILVLFLLQHLNWIERYSTMKIGRFFFVRVYIPSYPAGLDVLTMLWSFEKDTILTPLSKNLALQKHMSIKV